MGAVCRAARYRTDARSPLAAWSSSRRSTGRLTTASGQRPSAKGMLGNGVPGRRPPAPCCYPSFPVPADKREGRAGLPPWTGLSQRRPCLTCQVRAYGSAGRRWQGCCCPARTARTAPRASTQGNIARSPGNRPTWAAAWVGGQGRLPRQCQGTVRSGSGVRAWQCVHEDSGPARRAKPLTYNKSGFQANSSHPEPVFTSVIKQTVAAAMGQLPHCCRAWPASRPSPVRTPATSHARLCFAIRPRRAGMRAPGDCARVRWHEGGHSSRSATSSPA